MKAMADQLDQQVKAKAIKKEKEDPDQLKMDLPFDPDRCDVCREIMDDGPYIGQTCYYCISAEEEKETKKRIVKHRNKNGVNEKVIREYFGDQDPDNGILWMYYNKGMTQKQIGELIGVKQRAISQWLTEIPKKKETPDHGRMGD